MSNSSPNPENTKPVTVEIVFCTACNWLLRSSWMAQEILSTFSSEVAKLSLIPSKDAGQFEIRVNKETIWERKKEGGFPTVKELKQRVRDQINPEMDLGHVDNKK